MIQANVEYCSYYQIPKERYVIAHEHSCFELVYFRAGSGMTTVNGTVSYRFQEGDYILFRPYEVHDEIHNTITDSYCIGFTLDHESSKGLRFGLFRDEKQELWPLICKMDAEIKQKSIYSDQLINLYCCEFLLLHQRMQRSSENSDSYLLLNVIHYIDENYTQDINLSMLAQLSGYSYDYFRHRFQAEMGVSPAHYIINKRIELARQLLEHSSVSVTDIAYHCGFSNAALFSSTFKKYVGITPLKYRKQDGHIQDSVISRDSDSP